MMNKKAEGMNAAILVAIIAGLIILYIVFLPTSERERYVTGIDNKNGGEISKLRGEILLEEFPGSLNTNTGLQDEKRIPDVFLVETTTAKEIKRINPFIVKNGVLDQKSAKFEFELDDPQNSDNVMLSFSPKKRQGVLTIMLNDRIIFESEITSGVIEPVRLDNKLLERSNTLEFSVSSVGMKFWTTNEYNIENVKIVGDVTDTTRQASNNLFTLTDSEKSNVKRASLRFIPLCENIRDVGVLDVIINSKRVFSTVPVCSNIYNQAIPKSALNSGENSIIFKTNQGSYSVEQIKIILEFDSAQTKTYFFQLDSDKYDSIRSGDNKAVLRMKFVSGSKVKLDVNGNFRSVESRNNEYSEDISNLISKGNNFVKLEPLADTDVVELSVEFV